MFCCFLVAGGNFRSFRFERFRRRFSSQTIFSLSSGYGKCGVAVIRVSGPSTLVALRSLTAADFNPRPRFVALKSFLHPQTKEVIDRGLALWFPGPNSFTGEDSCEFQVHGGPAVVQAMLDALGTVPDLRMAKPGEYTRRAFFNGKMDLTEVEGLADIIHAETEAQRKQALLQSTGFLSKLYKTWRKKIMKSVAYLEATIDFAEDENIGDDAMKVVQNNIGQVQTEITNHLNDQRQGEILRDGANVAIIGAPNVGKSSFVNLISQRNISIVTSIAGTTRDIIETVNSIGGYPVIFADTAGLRKHTDDVIEREGISRSIDRMKSADLVVLMFEAGNLAEFCNSNRTADVECYIKDHFRKLGIDAELLEGKPILKVANKIDLLRQDERELVELMAGVNMLSCNTCENFDDLLKAFTQHLQTICGNPTAESPRLSNLRYRNLLRDCVANLESFLQLCSADDTADLAIAAQKLRAAIRSIEQITGIVTTDQILDIIFQDFCIGK